MRLLRGAGAIALMLFMLACQTVETEVTPFHTFADASPQGKTFIILPSKAQDGSLEWATYSNLVAQKLESKGLRRVESARAADYAVSLAYAIDGGRTTSSTIPVFGQTGGGTTYTTGTVGSRSVSATSYAPPTYGVTGYSTSTDTVYGRTVRITIMDVQKALAQNKRVLVYEATGKSEGTSGNINVVLPNIIDAMFVDWPGKSGVPQKQSIPLKQ